MKKNTRLSEALLNIDREFDLAALDWLISMYDPKSGGMYYSVSSRDNDEFEPDIESTAQTLSLLNKLGLITEGDEVNSIPEWFRDDVYRFLSGRQEESDGYFYDPVYRTTANKAKKERNTVFARNTYAYYLGRPTPYKTPMERFAASGTQKQTTDADQSMYASKESYLAWLEEIRAKQPDSYNWGSDISSGRAMITAAGYKQTTIDWLKSIQNTENGTWEKEFNITAVNGVLKICGYFGGDEPFPNYEIYVKNVIDFTKTFEPYSAASAWNPMGSLRVVLKTIPGGVPAHLKEKLESSIAEMIENTTMQMRKFRQPDGGFGYRKAGSSMYSNDVKVSLGLAEGDVNALALMALIYDEAYVLSDTPSSRVWEKYRDYFWEQMKAKYDSIR